MNLKTLFEVVRLIVMIDIYFIEFYIKRKYSQRLEEYYDVNKSIASNWRKKSFPERRLKEFKFREGTLDVSKLIEVIYKREI